MLSFGVACFAVCSFGLPVRRPNLQLGYEYMLKTGRFSRDSTLLRQKDGDSG
jgi:hypothetical protein